MRGGRHGGAQTTYTHHHCTTACMVLRAQDISYSSRQRLQSPAEKTLIYIFRLLLWYLSSRTLVLGDLGFTRSSLSLVLGVLTLQVGWGFTDSSLFQSDQSLAIRPEDKAAHLRAFLKTQTDGRPVVLVGASLGGAKALDFAHTYPEVPAGRRT